MDGLGTYFGHGLTEAELRYLVAREWAMTADDILWRRTKLGLRLDAGQKAHVREWLRSEEHTSELQSLMRISYAVFCLKKKNTQIIMYMSYYTNLIHYNK